MFAIRSQEEYQVFLDHRKVLDKFEKDVKMRLNLTFDADVVRTTRFIKDTKLLHLPERDFKRFYNFLEACFSPKKRKDRWLAKKNVPVITVFFEPENCSRTFERQYSAPYFWQIVHEILRKPDFDIHGLAHPLPGLVWMFKICQVCFYGIQITRMHLLYYMHNIKQAVVLFPEKNVLEEKKQDMAEQHNMVPPFNIFMFLVMATNYYGFNGCKQESAIEYILTDRGAGTMQQNVIPFATAVRTFITTRNVVDPFYAQFVEIWTEALKLNLFLCPKDVVSWVPLEFKEIADNRSKVTLPGISPHITAETLFGHQNEMFAVHHCNLDELFSYSADDNGNLSVIMSREIKFLFCLLAARRGQVLAETRASASQLDNVLAGSLLMGLETFTPAAENAKTFEEIYDHVNFPEIELHGCEAYITCMMVLHDTLYGHEAKRLCTMIRPKAGMLLMQIIHMLPWMIAHKFHINTDKEMLKNATREEAAEHVLPLLQERLQESLDRKEEKKKRKEEKEKEKEEKRKRKEKRLKKKRKKEREEESNESGESEEEEEESEESEEEEEESEEEYEEFFCDAFLNWTMDLAVVVLHCMGTDDFKSRSTEMLPIIHPDGLEELKKFMNKRMSRETSPEMFALLSSVEQTGVQKVFEEPAPNRELWNFCFVEKEYYAAKLLSKIQMGENVNWKKMKPKAVADLSLTADTPCHEGAFPTLVALFCRYISSHGDEKRLQPELLGVPRDPMNTVFAAPRKIVLGEKFPLRLVLRKNASTLFLSRLVDKMWIKWRSACTLTNRKFFGK